MRQQHAPATVSSQAKRVQRLHLAFAVLHVRQVRLPLVADDLAARETADRDDHNTPQFESINKKNVQRLRDVSQIEADVHTTNDNVCGRSAHERAILHVLF